MSFFVWMLWVILAFSWVIERDTSEASQLVLEQTTPLAERIETLGKQHGDLIAGVRQQMEDLERRAQSTFEQLGADLLPRSVTGRPRGISLGVEMSSPVGTAGGSRWGAASAVVAVLAAPDLGSRVREDPE